MSRQAVLALLDAAAGTSLVVSAVRRERRDKSAVLVTGLLLLACAAALGWLALFPGPSADVPATSPAPAGELA